MVDVHMDTGHGRLHGLSRWNCGLERLLYGRIPLACQFDHHNQVDGIRIGRLLVARVPLVT